MTESMANLRCFPPRSRGFSLIELLVVISIVAVLAGMLLPVVNTVRDAAHAARCRSNLRQFGMAFQLYADGNEGCFPPLCNAPPTNTDYAWWSNLIATDYLIVGVGGWKNEAQGNVIAGVWRCPAVDPSSVIIGWGGGYGMLEGGHGSAYQYAVQRALVTASATRALLVDAERLASSRWAPSMAMRCPKCSLPTGDWTICPRASARHTGRRLVNAVFYDGHVAGVSYYDMSINEGDIWRHVTR